MSTRNRTIVWLSIALFGSALKAMPPQKAGELKVETRSLASEDGAPVNYELGTLYVPENRTKPNSRVIGVGFARFRSATQPPVAPPIFLLPGGPGGSLVQRLGAASGRRLARMRADLRRYSDVSDLVLVDQRGFSPQGDMFRGFIGMPARPVDRPQTISDRVAAFEKFARKTVAKYAKKDIDLSGYNVKECAHDVDDVRKALGYEKITLCGTSFGSQWSFAVMRLHPDTVARALLSGVEPLNCGYDMPSYVFAAVQRMWRTVEADERFKPYLPEGGMGDASRVVIERLERDSIKLEVEDEAAGEKKLVGVLGPLDFPWSDPRQILEMYHGNFDRWTKVGSGRGGVQPIKLIGPLIDTSLGVTPERHHRLWTDPATRYLGRGNFAAYLATADIWPSPDVGDAFRSPVLCEIPVVFAQGTWDTKTPIENTFEIAPFFVNSRVLIAERGGHGVLDPIARELPKAWKTLDRFLRTGDLSAVPARVRLRASRVFRPPTFPAPQRR